MNYMQKFLKIIIGCFFTTHAFCGAMGALSSQPNQFYMGLGAGFDTQALNQQLYAFGKNQSFDASGTLTSYGDAGGYSNELPNTINTLSPQVQIGYLKHNGFSNYFWGFKGVYQYLNAKAVSYNFPIEQSGKFIDVASNVPSNNFNGNVIVESSQINTNHQVNLFALLGYSFDSCNLYLGAGPSLFAMQSKINHALPYADIDGVRTSESNFAISYSNTMWIFAGGAQLGITYFISPNWFLDFNYTAIGTGNHSINNAEKPIIKTSSTGKTTIGTLFINPTQSFVIQTISVTINHQYNF